MVLRPPVEPMLAQAAEVMPPVRPLGPGVAYEQKLWTELPVVRCPQATEDGLMGILETVLTVLA
ncbi:hypothetical protein [Streptomyces xanthophaeus]|uniref:hypothetical protein n=1 Tax=Streptomyces xanthophaeus TaxID=67385 RepID=UPI00371A641C